LHPVASRSALAVQARERDMKVLRHKFFDRTWDGSLGGHTGAPEDISDQATPRRRGAARVRLLKTMGRSVVSSIVVVGLEYCAWFFQL
jgi:hypothetical protein